MYKKLFQISNLSNGEICRRLSIDHNQRKQYQISTKIDFSKFVMFGKKLGVTEVQMTRLVVDGILELCK